MALEEMVPRNTALATALRALADALELEPDLAQPEPANDAQRAPDALLDRRGVGAMLAVSLAGVDRLCRRARDPLPYRRVGDVRRFDPVAVREWLSRQ